MMRYQRRQRTTFNREQVLQMKAAFAQNHYPDAQMRDELAKTIHLDPMKIQVWFQNQRAKNRKKRQCRIMSQQQLAPDPYCIYVFDSTTANEAAAAVKEGSYESIIAYHLEKHHLDESKDLESKSYKLGQMANLTQTPSPTSASVSPINSMPHQPQPTAEQQQQSISIRNDCRERIFEFANEAAAAVKDGQYDSIISYHSKKHHHAPPPPPMQGGPQPHLHPHMMGGPHPGPPPPMPPQQQPYDPNLSPQKMKEREFKLNKLGQLAALTQPPPPNMASVPPVAATMLPQQPPPPSQQPTSQQQQPPAPQQQQQQQQHLDPLSSMAAMSEFPTAENYAHTVHHHPPS